MYIIINISEIHTIAYYNIVVFISPVIEMYNKKKLNYYKKYSDSWIYEADRDRT